MVDEDVHSSIDALATEEHQLREREAHQVLSDDELQRFQWLEVKLDQCWDLLRQRRARRNAGLDPDEVQVRTVQTVEDYQQ